MYFFLVKKAKELHKKLEYVNEHQKCELKQCQGQLEQCRRELLEARVNANSDREVLQNGGEKKYNSQELRMVCIKKMCYMFHTRWYWFIAS